MLKMRLLAVVVCLAVPLLGATASAAVPWNDSQQQSWGWVDDGEGVCTLIVNTEFTDDSVMPFWIGGVTPADPNVEQTIRNRTSTYWTDWHVSIENAKIITGTLNGNPTPLVMNLDAPNPLWHVDLIYSGANCVGFDAHVISGQGTQVDYNEKLYVYFTYLPDTSGNPVKITQYPTHDYPVPEPASIISLLSGLAAVGFGIRRRA